MAITLRPTESSGTPIRPPRSIAKGLTRTELLELMTTLERERVVAVEQRGDRRVVAPDDGTSGESGSRAGPRLAAVRGAYQRLIDGSFNVCEHCGHPIGLKRLRLVPHSETCVPCAILAKDTYRGPRT